MKFLKSLEVLLTSRNAEMHIWLKCLGGLSPSPNWRRLEVFNKDVRNIIF